MANRKAKKRSPHELVGFLAIWAVEFQRIYELDGLHPVHYELMKKYGARMNDFKRATNVDRPITSGEPTEQKEAIVP